MKEALRVGEEERGDVRVLRCEVDKKGERDWRGEDDMKEASAGRRGRGEGARVERARASSALPDRDSS